MKTEKWPGVLLKTCCKENNDRYSLTELSSMCNYMAPIIEGLTGTFKPNDAHGKKMGVGLFSIVKEMMLMYEPKKQINGFDIARHSLVVNKTAHIGDEFELNRIGIVALVNESDKAVVQNNSNDVFNAIANYSKKFRCPPEEELPTFDHHKYIVSREKTLDYYMQMGSVCALVGEHISHSGEHSIGTSETFKCMTAASKSLNLTDVAGGVITGKGKLFIQQYEISHQDGKFVRYREDPVDLVQGTTRFDTEINQLKKGMQRSLTTLFAVVRRCCENNQAVEARDEYASYQRMAGQMPRQVDKCCV